MKRKLDRTEKQNLIDSNIKKKCNYCKKKKHLKWFPFKKERGFWYALYVCRLCQARLKNKKRKNDKNYKAKNKIRGQKRWREGRLHLKDFYVESTLHLKTPFRDTPKELIEAKRMLLILKRLIGNGYR